MNELVERIGRRMKEISKIKGIRIKQRSNGYALEFSHYKETNEGVQLAVDTDDIVRFCNKMGITLDEFFCEMFGKEKKYKIPLFKSNQCHLALNTENGRYVITYGIWTKPWYQKIFTESEIEKLKKDERLEGFDLDKLKVEVPDWEDLK